MKRAARAGLSLDGDRNAMILNLMKWFKVRRLTWPADGQSRNHALSAEESACTAEHELLHDLIQRAYRDDTCPEPPSEEEFVRRWLQRRAELADVQAKPAFPTRRIWTAVSLAAAAVLVFFALIYLFAPAGRPVTAGPPPTPHPDMERIFPPAEAPSGPDRVPRDSAIPERDM